MIVYFFLLFFGLVDSLENVTITNTTGDIILVETILRYIPIFILIFITFLWIGFRCFCDNYG